MSTPPALLMGYDTLPSVLPIGRNGLALSASDCGVLGPMFESHRRRLCLSRQPLRYAAFGTGSACTSTQPCTRPGSLNRLPVSAGERTRMPHLLCDPIRHVSSRSREANRKPTNCIYSVYNNNNNNNNNADRPVSCFCREHLDQSLRHFRTN